MVPAGGTRVVWALWALCPGPSRITHLTLPYQAPYLPAGQDTCTTTAGAEGVFSGPKSNIPWCVAMHSPLPKYPLTHAPSRSRPYILLALLHDTTPPRHRSIKWSRGLCNTLIAEGFWGGHTGLSITLALSLALYNPNPSPNPTLA